MENVAMRVAISIPFVLLAALVVGLLASTAWTAVRGRLGLSGHGHAVDDPPRTVKHRPTA